MFLTCPNMATTVFLGICRPLNVLNWVLALRYLHRGAAFLARTLTHVLLYPRSLTMHLHLAQNTSRSLLYSISYRNKTPTVQEFPLAKPESCISVPLLPLATAVLFSAWLATNRGTFLSLFLAATIAVSQKGVTGEWRVKGRSTVENKVCVWQKWTAGTW